MDVRARRLPTVLAVGLLAVTLAACGGFGGGKAGGAGGAAGAAAASKDLAPQDALAAAVDGLANRDALDVTLKLAVSPEDLIAVSKTGTSGKPLTPEQARLITSGDVQLTEKATDGAKLSAAKPGAAAFAFAVHADGGAIVEMRSPDGKKLFVRADVKKIAGLAGKPVAPIEAQVAALPPTLAFAKDAVAGRWLTIDLTALQNLGKQFGGTALPSADPTAARQAASQLAAALKRDVKATRGPASDRGDHLVLTASSRTLATDAVSTLSKAVPGGGAALKQLDPAKVPDTPITLDAYVKGGVLSVLSLDVAQFATGKDKADLAGKRLPLEITFATDVPSITTPTDAVTVDLTSVLGGLLGGLGGGGGKASLPAAAPLSTATP